MVKVGDKIEIIKLLGQNQGITLGNIYIVIELDNDPNFPNALFVIDDEGDENVVFQNEYRIVE